MKILMLTPYLPFPLLSGGQIRTYNLLKNLADKHEITLFSFIRKDEEEKYLPELLKFCKKIKLFKRRPAWSIFNLFLACFSPFPFLVSIYYSYKLKKAIKDELIRNQYNLIHAETFYVMPNIPETMVPMLLVEQTIEYLVYQHFVESFKFWPLKPFLYFDVLKIKFWEKYFWQKATKVVAMSNNDKKQMLGLVSNLGVDIVPNGVDIDFFSQVVKKPNRIPTVVFVGNFNWLQNREAVLILARDIWPLIKKYLKKARLWIVGRNPTLLIKNLTDETIVVDDSVDDIRKAYIAADVLLAPIKGGGGTRFKILEAMASGVPVVTTSMGIEGIAVRDGIEVLVRDKPSEMAEATVELLKNQKLADKLSVSAKKLVFEQYNWTNIAKKLDLIYREVGNE